MEKKKNKFKISYILICILLVVIIVETVLLVTGKLSSIPKTSNGDDILVSLNDGTSFTVNDVWNKTKETYGLTVILNDIDNKILGQELSDKSSDIDSYVKNTESSLKANYVDESGKYDESKLLTTLQNYGYNSLNDYLDQVRLSYMQNLAATNYAKTTIKEKDIKDYYDKSIYGDITGVHILVKPASTSSDDNDKAKKKAEQIISDINADVKSGTSLSDAFAKYKDDSSVTYEDLGTFNYNDMEEAFSKAAYALGVNEMSSSPVKTSYGYHIILKTAQSDKPSLEDKKDEIITTLAEKAVGNDSTLTIKALDALRTKYGVTWNDDKLKQDYDRYINYQLNQARQSTTNS